MFIKVYPVVWKCKKLVWRLRM